MVTSTLGNSNISAIMSAAPITDFIPASDAGCVQRCAAASSTAGK